MMNDYQLGFAAGYLSGFDAGWYRPDTVFSDEFLDIAPGTDEAKFDSGYVAGFNVGFDDGRIFMAGWKAE